MEWSILDIIMDRRLQWLGHLGCMIEERLPKKMMFGDLKKKRACHGTKGVERPDVRTPAGNWFER